MPQCEFLFSAVFVFQKVTQEIFSELDETEAEVPIYLNGRQSPEGRRSRTGRTIGWRGPPPGSATRWCGPLVHP
jgi:hypothetical protein